MHASADVMGTSSIDFNVAPHNIPRDLKSSTVLITYDALADAGKIFLVSDQPRQPLNSVYNSIGRLSGLRKSRLGRHTSPSMVYNRELEGCRPRNRLTIHSRCIK